MKEKFSPAFIATILGLLALLVVPLATRYRTDALHERAEKSTQPAHEQVNQAIEDAREARSVALASSVGAPEPVPEPYASTEEFYNALIRNFDGQTQSDRLIGSCGSLALYEWRLGVNALRRWLREYGPRYIAEETNGGELRMTAEELRKANDLFRKGTDHLRMARKKIEEVQAEQRDELVDATTSGVLITVPLALVSLLLAGLAWRSHRQILLSEARLHLAVKETNHRVKNNLQVVSALVDMHRMDAADESFRKALAEIGGQVKAMASVHDLLSKSDAAGEVGSDILLEKLVGLMSSSSRLSVDLNADSVPLDPHQATALALVANELLLNAAKHGATCARVNLTHHRNSATLAVEDDGPGFPRGFRVEKDANLGLAMVDTLMRHDLRGAAEFPTCGGSRILLRFPLPG